MTRSELYTLVWAEPVSTVGPRLGLSSAGLAKLCGRHDIPIPTRGFWARLAAGQTPARQALPAQATDEVIPRFKALDDSGAPSPADALPVEWIIPGVLQRTFTALKGGARAQTSAASLPRVELEVQVDGVKPSTPAIAVKAGAHASRPVESKPEPQHPRKPIGTFAAIDAECERGLRAALDHQRRQAIVVLLSAVAVRATEESPAASQSILAWVGAV